MKITIESTSKIVTLVNGRDGPELPARIWEGKTEHGDLVHCYIVRIATPEPVSPETDARFKKDLQECARPSAGVQAIPLRLIL